LRRLTAIVCSARFSCRSPPRSRRWRLLLPLEAGIGAAPASRANAAWEWIRPGCDQLIRSCAQVSGPIPGWLSSAGAAVGDDAGDLALQQVGLCGELRDAVCEPAQGQHPGAVVRRVALVRAEPSGVGDERYRGEVAELAAELVGGGHDQRS
jgi:hypothetical protein